MEDGTMVIDYRYDEDGRLAAKEYANQMQTLYSYNEAGNLESLTHQLAGEMLEYLLCTGKGVFAECWSVWWGGCCKR